MAKMIFIGSPIKVIGGKPGNLSEDGKKKVAAHMEQLRKEQEQNASQDPSIIRS